MAYNCDHLFEEDDNFSVCSQCGLETICMPTSVDNLNNSCYSVRLPDDDLNKYLVDVPVSLRKIIITVFENLLEKNNLRGEGKKALLSACYMYILLENGTILTYKDACTKFNVERKKFSEGKQLFLTHHPKYRTLERKSSEYVEKLFELLFSKFDLSDQVLLDVKEKCQEVDNDLKFVNFNPHSVCACVIFKTLEEKGINHIKKNAFIKIVGMSDVSVQKILHVLEKTKKGKKSL